MRTSADVTLLLIEDNPSDARLISEHLDEVAVPRFVVVHATTLEEGRRIIDERPPSAVLLDLSLPDSKGLETVRTLRTQDPNLPIIVLTGDEDETLATEALIMGAQDYLSKGRMTGDIIARSVRYALARGELLHQINESRARLGRAEKLEAVGRLAAGIAHDFNNQLTVIETITGLLLQDTAEGSQTREDLQTIAEAAERASVLSEQLLAFCRGRAAARARVNLNWVIHQMMQLIERVLGTEVQLDCDLSAESPFIDADRGQIEQVLLNLVSNARDAVGADGRIRIATRLGTSADLARARQAELTSRSFAVLTVEDDGVGMDEETSRRIFEPFFTTKARGQGAGLGLSTVYGVVRQHGGTIAVRTAKGRGSTFEILLPLAVTHTRESEAEPTESIPTDDTVVLLVEDDEMVRRALHRILRRAGYEVLAASNGPEALRIAREHSVPVALLVTDVVMPEMDGAEVARQIQALWAGTPVLFVSGYADGILEESGFPGEGCSFLGKPFQPDQLVDRVREMIGPPKR